MCLAQINHNMNIEPLTQEQHAIKNEIADAMLKLGAKSDLISIVMSWGDTLPQNDILQMMKEWNSKK